MTIDDSPRGRGKKRQMTAGPTTSLDGGKGRDHEVMNAAIELFWEKGYAATSVQDVADAVGMLKGSLYYYIKGKEDLLKRIFQDSHAEGMAIIESVTASDESAVKQLESFVFQWALWYLTNLKRTSLYSREWRHAGPELRKVLVKRRQIYDDTLIGLIKRAQSDGDVAGSLDPKMSAYYIMSAITALPDWYRPQGPRKAESVAGIYTSYSLRLLGSAP